MNSPFKNRVTEKDIRLWLDDNGFVGRTAKIEDLELYAIKRPGWAQVFDFKISCQIQERVLEPWRDEDEEDTLSPRWIDRLGVVFDDERNRSPKLKTQIWIFEDPDEQQIKLDLLSDDMIVRNSKSDPTILMWIAITAAIFLAIVTLLSRVL